MTTLSVLKDITEIKDLKIRILPIPNEFQVHPDIDWLRDEYSKWSKQFPGFNPRVDYLVALVSGAENRMCKSKERLLNITKAIEISFYIDRFLLPAREERSALKAQQLIENLLKALKTEECEEGFTPGKRLIEGLKPMRSELKKEQCEIVEMYLEVALKSHLDIHCNYWLKNRFIPLNEYVHERGPESFWPYIMLLSEYSVDYPIGADIRNNQLFQTLTAKISEHGLSMDDYYMSKIKIMNNDITTRIVCLLNEKGCSLQEAFDNQFEYSMDLYKQCIELRDKINANTEIASDKLSAWMDTAFNNSHTLFMILAEAQQIQVNDDQTFESPRWDQVYKELVSLPNNSVDPWDL